jgi:hypothetical protein
MTSIIKKIYLALFQSSKKSIVGKKQIKNKKPKIMKKNIKKVTKLTKKKK